MTANPYESPKSDIANPPDLPERPVRGILAGLVLDIGGTTVAGFVIVVIYSIVQISQGQTPEDVERALMSMTPATPLGFVTTLIGLALSYLGGYVCLKVSRGKTLAHAIILAVIVNVVSLIMGYGQTSPWLFLGLSVLGIAATLLGARQALRR